MEVECYDPNRLACMSRRPQWDALGARCIMPLRKRYVLIMVRIIPAFYVIVGTGLSRPYQI